MEVHVDSNERGPVASRGLSEGELLERLREVAPEVTLKSLVSGRLQVAYVGEREDYGALITQLAAINEQIKGSLVFQPCVLSSQGEAPSRKNAISWDRLESLLPPRRDIQEIFVDSLTGNAPAWLRFSNDNFCSIRGFQESFRDLRGLQDRLLIATNFVAHAVSVRAFRGLSFAHEGGSAVIRHEGDNGSYEGIERLQQGLEKIFPRDCVSCVPEEGGGTTFHLPFHRELFGDRFPLFLNRAVGGQTASFEICWPLPMSPDDPVAQSIIAEQVALAGGGIRECVPQQDGRLSFEVGGFRSGRESFFVGACRALQANAGVKLGFPRWSDVYWKFAHAFGEHHEVLPVKRFLSSSSCHPLPKEEPRVREEGTQVPSRRVLLDGVHVALLGEGIVGDETPELAVAAERHAERNEVTLRFHVPDVTDILPGSLDWPNPPTSTLSGLVGTVGPLLRSERSNHAFIPGTRRYALTASATYRNGVCCAVTPLSFSEVCIDGALGKGREIEVADWEEFEEEEVERRVENALDLAYETVVQYQRCTGSRQSAEVPSPQRLLRREAHRVLSGAISELLGSRFGAYSQEVVRQFGIFPCTELGGFLLQQELGACLRGSQSPIELSSEKIQYLLEQSARARNEQEMIEQWEMLARELFFEAADGTTPAPRVLNGVIRECASNRIPLQLSSGVHAKFEEADCLPLFELIPAKGRARPEGGARVAVRLQELDPIAQVWRFIEAAP
ncbi:hypothetical protein MRY87_05320 [bacterium]|nr:hypothetical protein [bacterium]